MQVQPQGITGLSYLGLSFVDPAQYPAQSVPWTPSSTVIPSIPSTLTRIQDALEQIMSSLSRVDLSKIVSQASTLTTTLTNELTTGDAHQAIAQANALLANLNAAVMQTNLPATSAAIRNLVTGPQTAQILARLNQTTAEIAKTSAQLPALVAASQATVNRAGDTTADLQSQLAPILEDMKATTANLRALSAELSRNPSQVILGAPPPPDGAAP